MLCTRPYRFPYSPRVLHGGAANQGSVLVMVVVHRHGGASYLQGRLITTPHPHSPLTLIFNLNLDLSPHSHFHFYPHTFPSLLYFQSRLSFTLFLSCLSIILATSTSILILTQSFHSYLNPHSQINSHFDAVPFPLTPFPSTLPSLSLL